MFRINIRGGREGREPVGESLLIMVNNNRDMVISSDHLPPDKTDLIKYGRASTALHLYDINWAVPGSNSLNGCWPLMYLLNYKSGSD